MIGLRNTAMTSVGSLNHSLQPSSTTAKTSIPASTANGHSRGETEVMSFLGTSVFRSQRQAVGKFLSILSWLCQRDEEKFTVEAMQIGGRTRKYFALCEQDLMQSGNSVNPKLIPGTKVWVVTNNDTPKKRNIVRDVMIALGLSDRAIQLMENTIA